MSVRPALSRPCHEGGAPHARASGALTAVGRGEWWRACELARNLARRVPTTLVTFGASRATRRSDRSPSACRKSLLRGQKINPFDPGLFARSCGVRRASCHHPRRDGWFCRRVVVFARARSRVRRVPGGDGWDLSAATSRPDATFGSPPHLSRLRVSIHRPGRAPPHVAAAAATSSIASTDRSRWSRRRAVTVGRPAPPKGIDYPHRRAPTGMPAASVGPPPSRRDGAVVARLPAKGR
jgi:hypothetical protein